MADRTAISWTDSTWSPVTGCSKVSPGCDNCYAERMSARLQRLPAYEGVVHPKGGWWTGRVNLVPEVLDKPLTWKKPRRVFVCSMSDLFHPAVPFEYIARVFIVMAAAQSHTFQVLTKRPGRMAYFANTYWPSRHVGVPYKGHWWPDNVEAGTSLEQMEWGNKRLYERVGLLAKVPARVRFLSAEPLLGPLDLRPWLGCGTYHPGTRFVGECSYRDNHKLSWVIAGGESGSGARPMNPDWVRSLRDQCQAAGVRFHFKQWGEWAPRSLAIGDPHGFADWSGEGMKKVGKKAAGAVLDGREHREFPDA